MEIPLAILGWLMVGLVSAAVCDVLGMTEDMSSWGGLDRRGNFVLFAVMGPISGFMAAMWAVLLGLVAVLRGVVWLSRKVW